MSRNFKIHFLKTFWSDCILLEKNTKFALIDTGNSIDKEYIIKYLDNLHVEELEFILITHFHCDHYGNLLDIIQNRKIKKVYIKEYSALDVTKANGEQADDDYRSHEQYKYNNFVKYCKSRKIYQRVEYIKQINFEESIIKLFNTNNKIKEIYNNESSQYYKKYEYNENYNSLVLYMEINNRKIYLAGDIIDTENEIESMRFMNYQIAKWIGQKIDIYKASHHGMNDGTSLKTLKMIAPKNIVITNHEESLKNNTLQNYGKENNCNIYYTLGTIVFKIDKNGNLEVQE